MIFKYPHLKDQFEKSPKALKEVLWFADSECRRIAGKELIVTCLWDDAPGRVSDTHKERRGADCRIHMDRDGDGKPDLAYLTDSQARDIVNSVNSKFYCSFMAIAIKHSVVGGMDHLHLQIPRSWLSPEELAAIRK